jgi:Ca2+-binding EF-hand superfamily protein
MASDEKLEKEFKRLDKDNDGSITIEELRKYYLPMQEMLGIAPQLAEQEMQGLIKRLDIDGNGKISFEGKNKKSFHIFHQP